MKKLIDISDVLKELGICANLKGYYYIRYAVMFLLNYSTDCVPSTTKILYPAVAKYYKTTASIVERAIRHAIEKGWLIGNIEFQNKLFGFSVDMDKGKPTNTEFIGTVADYIRMYKMEVAVK